MSLTTRHHLPALLLALLLCSSAFGIDERQVEQLRAARKYDEAIAGYQVLLKAPSLTEEQKVRYHWTIFDCLRQQRKNPEALAAVDRLLALVSPDDPTVRAAADARFDLLSQLNRREEAAVFAKERAAASVATPDIAFNWYSRAGAAWGGLKRSADAIAAWTAMRDLAQKVSDNRRLAESLWRIADEHWQAGNTQNCLEPLAQLVAIPDDTASQYVSLGKQRLPDCYLKLNRAGDARSLYQTFIAAEPSANGRQRYWLAIARTWQGEKNWQAAIDAAENCISAQAGMPGFERWYEAQSLIVDMLAAKGDQPAALQAALTCFDVADSRDRVSQSAARVATLLRQQDRKPDRAKAFIDWHATGTGADPLAELKREVNPARAKAFRDGAAALAGDASGFIQRGMMHAYLGEKQQAAAMLAEACRRAAGDDVAPAYSAFLFIGLRGVRGNAAGLDGFAQYLASGPADKEHDPLASLKLPAVDTSLPAAQEKTLKELRRRLQDIVADRLWPEPGRRDAVQALQRVHSALGDWSQPEVFAWYAAQIEAEKDNSSQELLAQGLLAAGRGTNLHWAAARDAVSQSPVLVAKIQKLLDPAAKSSRSPFVFLQRLQEQSRPETLLRK